MMMGIRRMSIRQSKARSERLVVASSAYSRPSFFSTAVVTRSVLVSIGAQYTGVDVLCGLSKVNSITQVQWVSALALLHAGRKSCRLYAEDRMAGRQGGNPGSRSSNTSLTWKALTSRDGSPAFNVLAHLPCWIVTIDTARHGWTRWLV